MLRESTRAVEMDTRLLLDVPQRCSSGGAIRRLHHRADNPLSLLSLRRPGDGRTFPIDREKLAKLREVNRRIRFGGREETSEGTEETDTMPSESESGSERDVVRRA